MRRDAADLLAVAAIAVTLFVVVMVWIMRQFLRSLSEHVRMNEQAGVILRALSELREWGWLVLLAIWGGTAAHIERMRKHNLKLSLATLFGDLIVSSFVGMLTAYVCVETGASFYLTAAACGVAGHQGGRAIALFANWLKDKHIS